jgi:GAF domain-containing protein/FHA domain-containing protein
MPGKLTLFPAQRAPRFLVLNDGEGLEVGRDPMCGLVIEDKRISKRHARLSWTGAGWRLEDLDSKNGTTVNGQPVRTADLNDRDWISFGGLIARFDRLTAAQAATLESQRLARIQTSAEMHRRLGTDLEPADLLWRLLEAAREVTRTERGFVLVVGPGGVLQAEVTAGFTAEELSDDGFRGSVGAVREALETGGPVVAANAPADPRLGKRPSVVAHGIGSLACVPLRHDGKMLGLIYVDSRKVGPAFTELDLETLEALADHAGTVLASARPEPAAPRVLGAAERDLVQRLQQRIQELLPAV